MPLSDYSIPNFTFALLVIISATLSNSAIELSIRRWRNLFVENLCFTGVVKIQFRFTVT